MKKILFFVSLFLAPALTFGQSQVCDYPRITNAVALPDSTVIPVCDGTVHNPGHVRTEAIRLDSFLLKLKAMGLGGGGDTLPLNQIGFGTGTGIKSSPSLTWDSVNHQLSVVGSSGLNGSFTGGTGTMMGGGLGISGISSFTLTNNAAIDYLNPNLRFSLPSTEGYYWYNQGRGVNSLMSIDGSTGVFRLGQYGSGTHTGTPAYKLSEDAAGNVIETPDSSGNSFSWLLKGNSSTNSGTNFIGTKDNHGLVMKANNQEIFRADTSGNITINRGGNINDGSSSSHIQNSIAIGGSTISRNDISPTINNSSVLDNSTLSVAGDHNTVNSCSANSLGTISVLDSASSFSSCASYSGSTLSQNDTLCNVSGSTAINGSILINGLRSKTIVSSFTSGIGVVGNCTNCFTIGSNVTGQDRRITLGDTTILSMVATGSGSDSILVRNHTTGEIRQIVQPASGLTQIYGQSPITIGGTDTVKCPTCLTTSSTIDTSQTNAVSNVVGTSPITVGTSGKTKFVSADTSILATKNFVDNNPQNLMQKVYSLLGSSIKAEVPGLSIRNITSTLAMASGTVYYIGIYVPQTITINGAKWFQNTAGNSNENNYNGIMLYSSDYAGNLSFIDSTARDSTIWTATSNTWTSKAFTTSHILTGGNIYYLGFLYSSSFQTTAPAIGAASAHSVTGVESVDFTNSQKLVGSLAGQTIPSTSSQAMSGLSTIVTNPYMALY